MLIILVIQKIKLKLNYIFDENRVGFVVNNGQEIFVYRDKIVDYGTQGSIYFADELMRIEIKLHEQ